MNNTIKKQVGAGMIEVLVSAVIMAVGILGIMAMQNRALQFSQQSHMFNQATVYAQDISERIRSNDQVVDEYLIDFGESTTATSSQCLTGSCTEQQLAQWDIKVWLDNLALSLPAGEGSIAQVGDEVVITVRFDSTRGEEGPQSVSFAMQI